MKTDTASLRNMAKSELSKQENALKLCNEAADEIEMLREKLFWKSKYHAAREQFLENSIKFKSDLADMLEQDMEESKSIIRKNMDVIKPAIGASLKLPDIMQSWEAIEDMIDETGK